MTQLHASLALILGDAVTLDGADDGRALLDHLRADPPFQVEVRVEQGHTEWVAGSRTVATWFDAAKFAILLSQKVESVLAVRVTPE